MLKVGEKTGEREVLKHIFQNNDTNGNRELDPFEFEAAMEVITPPCCPRGRRDDTGHPLPATPLRRRPAFT